MYQDYQSIYLIYKKIQPIKISLGSFESAVFCLKMAAIPEAARASCFAGHDLQSCGPAVCCWPVKKLAKICTRHQKQKKGKRINHWITDFLHCFCAMNFIIASKYKKEVLSFKDQTTDTFEFIELCSVTVAFGSLEARKLPRHLP